MPNVATKPAADYHTSAPREDGWTYERQASFLVSLSESGIVALACKVAGMSPASAYALRREARGRAFALGWQAAHLLARDRVEDILLAAAIEGVQTFTTRNDETTIRTSLNGNLSMAVLNRLDKRAAALDDRGMAVARSICSAFEDYLGVVLDGGKAEDIAAFLEANPDPLAVQVAAYEARHDAQTVTPVPESSLRGAQRRGNPASTVELDCFASLAMTANATREGDGLFGQPTPAPQLVEESATFSNTLTPCDCHADLIAA